MALTQFQYDEIEREYSRRQLKSRRELSKRIDYISKTIPEIDIINRKISSSSLEQAKKILQSDTPENSAEYHKNIQKLIKKKAALLKEHGFPADYLNIHHTCEKCADTGYLSNNEKCVCRKQAEIKLLYSQSNIENVLEIENFDNFNFKYFDSETVNKDLNKTPLQNIQEVYDICQDFIRKFDTDYANLYIYGNTGVGKTYLANCIAKALMDSSHSVIYLSAINLFNILADRDFNRTQSREYKHIAHHLTDCDLLIIDDLGTELSNTFTVSALFQCLNERIISRKPVIISTNLSLHNLQTHYSERILSRIVDNYKMLKIIGNDIRINR